MRIISSQKVSRTPLLVFRKKTKQKIVSKTKENGRKECSVGLRETSTDRAAGVGVGRFVSDVQRRDMYDDTFLQLAVVCPSYHPNAHGKNASRVSGRFSSLCWVPKWSTLTTMDVNIETSWA